MSDVSGQDDDVSGRDVLAYSVSSWQPFRDSEDDMVTNCVSRSILWRRPLQRKRAAAAAFIRLAIRRLHEMLFGAAAAASTAMSSSHLLAVIA